MKQHSTIIKIQVKPNSKNIKIDILENDLIKIHLKSPPIENKANKELISLLAKILQIPKNNIILKSGNKSKIKFFRLIGIDYNLAKKKIKDFK